MTVGVQGLFCWFSLICLCVIPLRYHATYTHDTTPSHIILTLGQCEPDLLYPIYSEYFPSNRCHFLFFDWPESTKKHILFHIYPFTSEVNEHLARRFLNVIFILIIIINTTLNSYSTHLPVYCPQTTSFVQICVALSIWTEWI